MAVRSGWLMYQVEQHNSPEALIKKRLVISRAAQELLGKEELVISRVLIDGQTLADYVVAKRQALSLVDRYLKEHAKAEQVSTGTKEEMPQQTQQQARAQPADLAPRPFPSSSDGDDESGALFEENESGSEGEITRAVQTLGTGKGSEDVIPLSDLHVLFSYAKNSGKRSVQDFVLLFNSRFKHLDRILRTRQELANVISISKILQKKDKEKIAFIGMVVEKTLSKNNNYLFTMEDPTGTVTIIVTARNPELFALAKDICLDEVIGVTGSFDKFVFAQNIYLPDIPLTKELKKSPVEEYIAFVGDAHFGSKVFLEKEFKKMLLWLNGETGSEEQRRIASKVKYLIFMGDLVEGVGIYPNQEKDLALPDVYDQYALFKESMMQIPKHIRIVIIPGNHDVGRLSEPQPSLFFDTMKDIADFPNVLSLSNPALFTVGAHPELGFPGFEVLLYHGGSIPYYAENVPSIRSQGGLKRTDLVMKYLLQRRHLAPTHTSTIYVPDAQKDPLLIDTVPDFFVTGHIHKMIVSSYRNVTLINASCWVGMTDYQEKRGIIPEPGRLPLINLQTREVKVLNFLSREDQEKEAQQHAEVAAKAAGISLNAPVSATVGVDVRGKLP